MARVSCVASFILLSSLCEPVLLGQVQILNRVTSNQDGLARGSCSTPPLVTTFAVEAPRVYLYFDATGTQVGGVARSEWYRPDSGKHTTTTWRPITEVGWNGYQCFSAWLSLGGTNVANYPGTWTVRVYWNSSTSPLFSLTFTVGSESPRGPQPPAYEGYFDPIEPGCSHFAGWARDRNNPTNTVNVDIAVEGFPKLTAVPANDSTRDFPPDFAYLRGHAWNKYHLQLYEDGRPHLVRVYYSGTTEELAGSPRTFPPEGAQPGCFPQSPPPSPLTANWVQGSVPPQTMTSGQTASVRWQVSGPSQILSRLCYGISSDPATMCQQTATYWQSTGTNTSGTYSDSIIAPTTSQQTLYAVVHAQANGQTVYTQPVQITVGVQSPPPAPRHELRIYSSDASKIQGSSPRSQLENFYVVMDKTRRSGNIFEYKLCALSDSLWAELEISSMTMIVPESMDVIETSFRVERSVDVPGGGQRNNIIAGIDRGWEDLSVVAPKMDAYDYITSQVWGTGIGAAGFFGTVRKVPVGNLISAIAMIGDLSAEIIKLTRENPDVYPSSEFSLRAQNVNAYDAHSLNAAKLESGINFDLTYGVRYTVMVDESSGDVPWFYLKVKNEDGAVVGVEIRGDRSNPTVCRHGRGCSQ